MSGGSRRGSLASLSLLLLAAPLLGLAPAALASVPRGAATLSAPSRAADVDVLATSPLEHTESADFRVFAGDELGTARLRTFEPSYPETRVGGFGLPGEVRVGAERSLRLRAPWACDERSCGRATGSGEFRIFDPSNSPRTVSSFGWNRLFQGREYLGFVDAYDFRARILWPEIGRFGQEDPAGTRDSLNEYQALRLSWPNFIEPLGLSEQTPEMKDQQCQVTGIGCPGSPDPLALTHEPGFAEGLIPIWGSGRQAHHDFVCGHYGWGIFNSALAISDVFLVKAAFTAVGKAGVSGLVKGGSHSWRATRRWLGKLGIAEKYQHVHHWLVHREWFAGTKWEALFNQRWNLLPLDPPPGWTMDRWHKAIEGRVPGLTRAERFWYGTPDGAKAAAASAAGRGVGGLEEPCGCE